VSGVSEGVVDGDVSTRFLKGELDTSAIARANADRLKSEQLVSWIGIDTHPVKDRAHNMKA